MTVSLRASGLIKATYSLTVTFPIIKLSVKWATQFTVNLNSTSILDKTP